MNLPDLTSLSLPAARALVHFLWQGLAVALVAAGILACMRRSSPSRRYAVALGALVVMAAMPVLTLMWGPALSALANPAAPAVFDSGAPGQGPLGSQSGLGAMVAAGSSASAETPAIDLLTSAMSLLVTRFEAAVVTQPAMLVSVWAFGVVLFLTLHLGGVRRLRGVLRDAEAAPPEWQGRLDLLARSLRVGRRVDLRESSSVDVPMVAGWLRPVIVVPASAFFGLAPEQLEAVLGHELAHVRRGDFLVNLFQVAMETVFFYHPAVWWLSHRVRIEREHCCDDLAIEVAETPVYVRALATLEGLRGSSTPGLAHGLAQGADGGSLLARVRRLAGQDGAARTGRPGPASQIFGTLLAAVLAAGLAAAGVYLTDTGKADALPAAEESFADEQEAQDSASAQDSEEARERDRDRSRDSARERERERDRHEERDRDERRDRDRERDHDLSVHVEWSHGDDWLEEDARELRAAAAGTRWSNLDEGTFHQLARWGFDEELFVALERAGISATGGELETLARYGIEEELIEAMAETDLPADAQTLASLGRYGVDGEDLIAYQRAGLATNGDDILRLARYGMDGDDIAELAAAGYAGLSTDELSSLARYGLDGDDVAEFGAAGYDGLSVDELIRLARHGVDGDDIAELTAAGYGGLTVDEIVELARHGVDGEDIAELERAGLQGLTLDQIRDLARHGVDGDDVEELRRAGLTDLSFDDILSLARHGVDGDDVEELHRGGLSGLSVDQIVNLARYGIDGDDLQEVRAAGYDVSYDEVMGLARSGRLWQLDDDDWDHDDDWDA